MEFSTERQNRRDICSRVGCGRPSVGVYCEM